MQQYQIFIHLVWDLTYILKHIDVYVCLYMSMCELYGLCTPFGLLLDASRVSFGDMPSWPGETAAGVGTMENGRNERNVFVKN